MTHVKSKTSMGTSIEVRRVGPSVDPATLGACLADAAPLLRSPGAVKPNRRWPLFTWQPSPHVLAIDPRAVISGRIARRIQRGSDAPTVQDAQNFKRSSICR